MAGTIAITAKPVGGSASFYGCFEILVGYRWDFRVEFS